MDVAVKRSRIARATLLLVAGVALIASVVVIGQRPAHAVGTVDHKCGENLTLETSTPSPGCTMPVACPTDAISCRVDADAYQAVIGIARAHVKAVIPDVSQAENGCNQFLSCSAYADPGYEFGPGETAWVHCWTDSFGLFGMMSCHAVLYIHGGSHDPAGAPALSPQRAPSSQGPATLARPLAAVRRLAHLL